MCAARRVALQTAPKRLQGLPQTLTALQPDSWRSGKTSSQRGYDYRWQKARARYLCEHSLCVMCDRDGIVTAATVVDHVIPHRGDQQLFWDEHNWQSLCKPHHDGEKAAQEAAARRGFQCLPMP